MPDQTPPTGEAAAAAPWHHRHRRLLGLVGAVVAAGMTLLWLVVVPESAGSTDGVRSWAVRYGHPAAWACLTGLGLAVAAGAPRAVRDGLAWAALGSYAAFVLAMVL